MRRHDGLFCEQEPQLAESCLLKKTIISPSPRITYHDLRPIQVMWSTDVPHNNTRTHPVMASTVYNLLTPLKLADNARSPLLALKTVNLMYRCT
jgi:hypothetical protein